MNMEGVWQQAGEHGAEAVAESFHPDPKAESKEQELSGPDKEFQTSKPTPRDTASPTRSRLILPKQFH